MNDLHTRGVETLLLMLALKWRVAQVAHCSLLAHLKKFEPTAFGYDGNCGSACIDAILQQLFESVGRPVDHLRIQRRPQVPGLVARKRRGMGLINHRLPSCFESRAASSMLSNSNARPLQLRYDSPWPGPVSGWSGAPRPFYRLVLPVRRSDWLAGFALALHLSPLCVCVGEESPK